MAFDPNFYYYLSLIYIFFEFVQFYIFIYYSIMINLIILFCFQAILIHYIYLFLLNLLCTLVEPVAREGAYGYLV